MTNKKKKEREEVEEVRDVSKSNPALHGLYVSRAVHHLAVIEECISKIDDLSNLNMLDIQIGLQDGYAKLLRTNTAYAEAKEILDSIRNVRFFRKRPHE